MAATFPIRPRCQILHGHFQHSFAGSPVGRSRYHSGPCAVFRTGFHGGAEQVHFLCGTACLALPHGVDLGGFGAGGCRDYWHSSQCDISCGRGWLVGFRRSEALGRFARRCVAVCLPFQSRLYRYACSCLCLRGVARWEKSLRHSRGLHGCSDIQLQCSSHYRAPSRPPPTLLERCETRFVRLVHESPPHFLRGGFGLQRVRLVLAALCRQDA